MHLPLKNAYALIVIVHVLAGCVSIQSSPDKTISKLPVVRVGETPPAGSEFILFYPAGAAIPVKLNVSGSLFTIGKEIESEVTLSRDLYLYKQWASYNGVAWKDSKTLFTAGFEGGFSADGIQVNVTLEQK